MDDALTARLGGQQAAGSRRQPAPVLHQSAFAVSHSKLLLVCCLAASLPAGERVAGAAQRAPELSGAAGGALQVRVLPCRYLYCPPYLSVLPSLSQRSSASTSAQLQRLPCQALPASSVPARCAPALHSQCTPAVRCCPSMTPLAMLPLPAGRRRSRGPHCRPGCRHGGPLLPDCC